MKILTLIEQLKNIEKIYGDLTVYVWLDQYGTDIKAPLEELEVIIEHQDDNIVFLGRK